MSAPRETVRRLSCFGGVVRVLVGGPARDGTTAALAALVAEARLREVHRRLTRFDHASELSQLNAAQQEVVLASRMLRDLARAVVRAGEDSGGLVDATRLSDLERAGYAASREGLPGLPLAEVLRDAPAAAAADRHRSEAWRRIHVDDVARTIARPPGVRIDSGGLGKGLAADLVAAQLATHATFAIDCAGDVRIGGSARRPRSVRVEDPFDPAGPPLHEFEVVDGAAATSGIGQRSWRDADGRPAHHIIDPATGRPAWTGVVQATALAPTALEAEILAKSALLAGRERGHRLLRHGGVLVLADLSVEIAPATDGAQLSAA